MRPRLRLLLLGLALAALPPMGPAAADPHDQDAVRQAVKRGEIRPLADILAGLSDKLPGDVVGVEIDRKRASWRYELRVLDGAGRLYDVDVDAGSGAIERIREK